MISLHSKTDRLCSDSTGTVQNMGGSVKSILCKKSVQNDSLLLYGSLPIKKQLIVLRSQAIIKGLCDIHDNTSLSNSYLSLCQTEIFH